MAGQLPFSLLALLSDCKNPVIVKLNPKFDLMVSDSCQAKTLFWFLVLSGPDFLQLYR